MSTKNDSNSDNENGREGKGTQNTTLVSSSWISYHSLETSHVQHWSPLIYIPTGGVKVWGSWFPWSKPQTSILYHSLLTYVTWRVIQVGSFSKGLIQLLASSFIPLQAAITLEDCYFQLRISSIMYEFQTASFGSSIFTTLHLYDSFSDGTRGTNTLVLLPALVVRMGVRRWLSQTALSLVCI